MTDPDENNPRGNVGIQIEVPKTINRVKSPVQSFEKTPMGVDPEIKIKSIPVGKDLP